MHDYENLQTAISELKRFNNNHEYVSDDIKKLDGKNQLNEQELELNRIMAASKIKPAVGVFGASQCGKSFLVSELSGGKESKLNIEGLTDKNFQDYNIQHGDKETTAVVTRFTEDKYEREISEHILLKLLSPVDIMWGFVYGFYNELKYTTGFSIDEESENDIKSNIENIENGSKFLPSMQSNVLFGGFSEAINHIKETYGSEHTVLAEYANLVLNQKSTDTLDLNQIALVMSTLWKADTNITKAFKTMLLTLESFEFTDEVYIPANQLDKVLNVATMQTINLDFNNIETPNFENNQLQFSNDNITATKQVGSIQAIIKEAVLPISSNNTEIIDQLDILDFPGARALSDQQGAPNTEEIKSEISKNQSTILANAYKRGRLLYLFDLYCKNYDVTLLVFCSQGGNQNTPIIKVMLDNWIEKHASKEKTPQLFSVFTKADLLLLDSTVEEADKRLSGRFKEHFSDYYGNWINKWPGTGETFQNTFLVRNPQVRAFPYQLDDEGSEEWINNGEDVRNKLYEAWSSNESVGRYLSDRSETIFNSVFAPGNDGIDRLVNALINKYRSSPNQKQDMLGERLSDVNSQLKNYIDQYITISPSKASEKQQNEAKDFIRKIEAVKGSVSTLVNGITKQYPNDKVLEDAISIIKKQQSIDDKIFSDSPLIKAIDGYISIWLAGCSDSDIHKTIGIKSGEMNKYLDNITKYLTDKDVLGELKEDLPEYFEDNPNDIRQLNKYVKWICCDYLYHLGEKNTSELPHSPIKIDGNSLADFQNEILTKWKRRLPEIYAGFYTPAPENPGNDILTNVHNNLLGA